MVVVQSLCDIEEDKIFRDRAPFHLVNGYDGGKSVASIFRVLFVKADCPEDGGRRILQDVDNRLRNDKKYCDPEDLNLHYRCESLRLRMVVVSSVAGEKSSHRILWQVHKPHRYVCGGGKVMKCRSVVCFRTAVV